MRGGAAAACGRGGRWPPGTALGGLTLAQQRAGLGVDAERPVGVARLRLLAEARERVRARSSAFPVLVAASISSPNAHAAMNSSGVPLVASTAAARASS